MENEDKKKRIDAMRVVQNGLLFLICAMAVIGFGGVVITDDLITMSGANNTGGNLLNYTIITDSIATLTAGAWTGLVSVTATTFSDGTASLSGGVLTDADLSGSVIANGEDTVLYLPFEAGSGTTAYDAERDNDGTMTNMNTGIDNCTGNCSGWTYDGKFRKGIVFDGTNDYIHCGNDVSLNITDEITVSAWIKGNVNDTGLKIVGSWEGSNQYILGISNDNKIKLELNTGNYYSATKGTYEKDVWTHIAFTYDSNIDTYATIYQDGLNVGTLNTDGNPLNPIGSYVLIGAYTTYSGDLFNGTIDEVKIYNTTRSSQEIHSSYLSGLSSHSPVGNLMPKAGGNFTGIIYTSDDICQTNSTGDIIGCLCVNSTNDWLITTTPSDCAA